VCTHRKTIRLFRENLQKRVKAIKMTAPSTLQDLRNAIVGLDAINIGHFVRVSLETGDKPMEILNALNNGMKEIGDKYESKEYFLTDLIMAGETMKRALEVLKPHLAEDVTRRKGKVILGTIQGDLHDIGKEIVKTLLLSSQLEVHDIGIDVPPRRFVEKAMEVNADVIGISALLSVTVPTTAKVVEELRKEGIREKVKVIIGGAACRPYHVEKYGVDAAVNDAIEGIRIIQKWCSKNEL